MKKLLAIILAALTVFSFCSLAAFAEDATEPETEPVETKEYEICEDPDFLTIQYMEKGNDAATILYPGDTIKTYKNSDIDVLYYPDADAMYKGAWEPADTNNLAFSPSEKEYVKETFKKKVGMATIRGLDSEELDIDFTIAYSDENVFVGWVVYSYEPALNTIKLCAVWDKKHKEETKEKVDDMYYIVDFFFSLRKTWHDNITMPVLKMIRVINNAFLYVKTWLYNQIFGQEPVA